MPRILNKEQILEESEAVFRQLADYCITVPGDIFFKQPSEKWSIAQNLAHLIISVKTTVAAYALPKWMVRFIGGRPSHDSLNYDELVTKYLDKLAAGGKAHRRYVPSKIHPSRTKDKLLNQWTRVTHEYLTALRQNWTTPQLDRYIARHPLLGKITLRELCYFTIYHIRHHLEIMRSRNADMLN
jgi:hypothetical protein